MSANLPAKRVSTALSGPLVKLAHAANREHEKALKDASGAVQHAVRSGEILARAREMCDSGEWTELVAAHFHGSMRTAQKYMRLARHIRHIQAQGPVAALTSQNEAAKALTAIIRGDGQPTQKSGSKRTRRARGASLKDASGLVVDALRLLTRIEQELQSATSQSYHARVAADSLSRGRADLEERYAQLIVAATEAQDASTILNLNPPEAINGGFDDTD